MKNLILLLAIFVTTIVAAQEITTEKTHELSYGITIGGNFYNIANNNTADAYIPEDISPSLVLGVYGEYNFTKNMGVKLDVLYYNKDFLFDTKDKLIEMDFIDISTNFKYDFGDTYTEGFYLIGGPKISIIANANSDNEDVKHHFETLNLGAQLGFGWRVHRYIDIQTKLEYEITPFFKLDNGHNSKFVNAILSANFDLARIIN
ncbi:MAG: PorT family protein [Flavobacterium sp.]|nr:PorT family protein [Flavobacterium sp.]MDP5097258.1 PorT family protein [Flavobacterium sp.]